MRKILLLMIPLALLLYNSAQAQVKTIAGKVTSAETGEPLPGVNVILKNSSSGTITDVDGNYTIDVSSEGALIFSFIGFAQQEVNISANSIINVALKTDVRQLNEVVVTAFGIEREKKVLSYSVQEVEGDRITQAGTSNTVNALQGKIAGVQVNQSSGMPGSSSMIRIRGSNSFSANNQPLFVVDGTPIESNPSTSGGVTGLDYSSRALDLNPNDIESINVLKGASAAALYGTRASNGVVVITTKSGKGMKPGSSRINLSHSYMVDKVSRIPDLQDVYAQGSGGNFNRSASTSWGPEISRLGDPEVNPLADGSGKYINNVGELVSPTVYDNVNPFFETGHSAVTNVDISGASDNGNYIFSIGHTDQSGIIPGTGMDKINAKAGGEFKLSKNLTSGAVVNFAFTDIDKAANGSNLSNPLFALYWAPRSYDLHGTPISDEADPYKQISYRGAIDNPLWSVKHNSFNEKITRTFGNTYLNYKPLDWLQFNYKLGIDAFTEERKEVYELGSGQTGGRTTVPTGGSITDLDYTYRQLNSTFNILIADNITEDLFFDVLLGNEVVDIRTKTLGVTGSGMTIGGLHNIGNTSSQVVNNNTTAQRTVGFYANGSLAFREYLFLNASGRQDYVSNMPANNRTFFYPSIGIGFVFTEAFNMNSNTLSFGKIRASYAEVGQPGPLHASQVTFVPANPANGFTTDDITFPFNGINGFQLGNQLVDENLVPQNTKTFEVGLQANFFGDRLGIDITYFDENTTDQIFAVPTPTSTGYTSILRNAGELSNKGIELTLTGTPVRSGKFSWDIIANYTKYESEVVELAEGVDNIFLGGFVAPNVRAYAGYSYPVIFGTAFLRDDNGNIVVDSRQYINGDENPSYGMPVADPNAKAIGNVNPDFEIGFSNSFSYGPLTLNAHIDIRKGGKAYAGNTRLQKLYGMDEVTEDRNTPVVLKAVKGYYSQTDDGEVIVEVEGVNDIAILTGQHFWNTAMDAIDESNVYDTDFIRLREIMLSFELPSKILDRTFINNASVYVLGRNLGLWTKYPNFDPETSVGGAGNFQGLEYVNLPQTKSFGAGVKLTF